MGYFPRKHVAERFEPLSNDEFEQRSDDALLEPWEAPRINYGSFLCWKEFQAARFRAEGTPPDVKAALERNREQLRKLNLDPEPWKNHGR